MKTKLDSKDLFCIALGSVIGWGAFVLPGNLFLPDYGVLNTAVGMLVAAGMIYFIGKSYTVLSSRFKEEGGEYIYAKKVLGDKSGFFTGWLLTLSYLSIIPLNSVAIPLVLDSFPNLYTRGELLYTVVDSPIYFNDLIISCGLIFSFALINIVGLNVSKTAQNTLVFVLVTSIFILLICSVVNVDSQNIDNFESNLGHVELNSVIRIIAFAPWAFLGFDTVAHMSSDYKVSPELVFRNAFIAVVIAAVIYNILNVFTALGLNNESLSTSTWATGDAVSNILGEYALYVLGFAVLGAILSGLNAFFMASTRLIHSIIVNEKPNKSGPWSLNQTIVVVGVISILVPFMGREVITWFVDISSVGASFAYLMTCLCAYYISTRSVQKLYAASGVCFSIMFLIFLLTPYFDSNIPKVSAMCLIVWSSLGIVLYSCWNKNDHSALVLHESRAR